MGNFKALDRFCGYFTFEYVVLLHETHQNTQGYVPKFGKLFKLSLESTFYIAGMILFIMLNPSGVDAQKQISHQNNVWMDYSSKFHWNECWGSSQNISLRRNDYLRNWQQSLFRASIDYKFSKNFELSQGIDRVMNYPYGAFPISKKTIEYRVYQQISKHKKLSNGSAVFRFKLETRFIGGWYAQPVNNRARSKFELTKKLRGWSSNSSSLHLWIFDEVFINVVNPTQLNLINQNWSYLGVRYSHRKNKTITLGLLDQYILEPDGKHIENNFTFVLGYSINFGQRKLTT